MNKGNKERFIAGAVGALIFCLGLAALNATHLWWSERINDHLAQLADNQASDLESQLQTSLAAAEILAAYVHTRNGRVDDFDEFARAILSSLPAVASLSLAPDGIVTQVYPRQARRPHVGQVLLAGDARHPATGWPLLTRPLVLLTSADTASVHPGAEGVVPVSLHGPSPSEHATSPAAQGTRHGDLFWGFADVRVELDVLLAATELPRLVRQNYAFHLWRPGPVSGEKQTLAGQADLKGNALVRRPVAVADSLWFFELAYLGPTLGPAAILTLAGLNILVTILAGLGVHQLLVRPRQLQELVDQRTAELACRNGELRLERQELKKFRNAVEESGNSIIITNARGMIEYVNPRFTEITGYSRAEAIGATPALIKSPFTRQEEHAQLWRTISHGKKWRGERRNTRKDGSHYWSLMSISPIRDPSGVITHYISISEDITDNKEQQQHIERMAFHDPLTGLANRRHFLNQLDQCLKLAARTEQAAAVLFVDLDHFKMINDTFGHDFGDELLKVVARKMLACTRESDLSARLGGDEFTILLPNLQHTDDAQRVAEKLTASINEPLTLKGQNIQQSVSIGINLVDKRATGARQVMHRADLALYEAKRSGRNTFRIYQPETEGDATNAAKDSNPSPQNK